MNWIISTIHSRETIASMPAWLPNIMIMYFTIAPRVRRPTVDTSYDSVGAGSRISTPRT